MQHDVFGKSTFVKENFTEIQLHKIKSEESSEDRDSLNNQIEPSAEFAKLLSTNSFNTKTRLPSPISRYTNSPDFVYITPIWTGLLPFRSTCERGHPTQTGRIGRITSRSVVKSRSPGICIVCRGPCEWPC